MMIHGFESASSHSIGSEFAPDELSLLTTSLTRKDVGYKIRCLSKDDAQAFVDLIDGALDRADLSLGPREIYLIQLYRMCGYHALLPKASKVSICYDQTKGPSYQGGYADVWKGEYCGQEVAVKVIRTYPDSDLQKVVSRFCKEVVTWKSLQHPNVLPLIGAMISENRFAMVSEWMDNGNINEFVKANPDENRLKLLGGVARGLIYIHQQEMVHGDLKGANILIDQTGQVRLADFGLLTIVSDYTNPLPSGSLAWGGTTRWMGPELINPQEFGLKAGRPTKFSDCYSLGMVIYETVSGNLPFYKHPDPLVVLKVSMGERPHRSVGFAESLWKILEQCWASQPSERPSVEGVLQCLDMCSELSVPPSLGTGGGMGDFGFYDLTLGGQGYYDWSEYSSLPDSLSSGTRTDNSRTQPVPFVAFNIFRNEKHRYRTELNNFLQVNSGPACLRWKTVEIGPQDQSTWITICYGLIVLAKRARSEQKDLGLCEPSVIWHVMRMEC